MPMHRSNRDFFHSDQRPNHAMELCHHTLNFIGSMRRHVDARRERLTFATHHHNRDIRTRLDFREHPSQLFHHRNVDHVERRIAQ